MELSGKWPELLLVELLGPQQGPPVFPPEQQLGQEPLASPQTGQTGHPLALQQPVPPEERLRGQQLAEFVAVWPVASLEPQLELVPALPLVFLPVRLPRAEWRLASRLVGRTSHWLALQRRVLLAAQRGEPLAELAAALPAGSLGQRLERGPVLALAFLPALRLVPEQQQVFQVLEQMTLGP